jgi:hypothetical protein
MLPSKYEKKKALEALSIALANPTQEPDPNSTQSWL